jgi:hypothetical protein
MADLNPLSAASLWTSQYCRVQFNDVRNRWEGDGPGNLRLDYGGAFPTRAFEFWAYHVGDRQVEPLTVTVDGVATVTQLNYGVPQKISVPAATTSLSIGLEADVYPDGVFTPVPDLDTGAWYSAFAAGPCRVRMGDYVNQIMAPGDTVKFDFEGDPAELRVDADGHVAMFANNVHGNTYHPLLDVVPQYEYAGKAFKAVNMMVIAGVSGHNPGTSNDYFLDTPIDHVEPVAPALAYWRADQPSGGWSFDPGAVY